MVSRHSKIIARVAIFKLLISLPVVAQTLNFSIASHGDVSFASSGVPNLNFGYARIQAQIRNGGYGLPSGMAIFSNRPYGILVSEASVPASPLISSGRIYAEVAESVNTGLAIANPNNQPVTIDFYFTNAEGNNFGQGSTVIDANHQIAAFLNERPFNGMGRFQGTFTFKSSLLVSAIALRGFTNERGEFLTRLPVVPRYRSFSQQFDNSSVCRWCRLADQRGAGQSHECDDYGELRPYAQNGQPLAMTLNGVTNDVFSYSISSGSFSTFRSEGAQSNVQVGFISINPDSTSSRPSAFVIFRYSPNGITVSEASVPAESAAMVKSLFVESAGSFGSPGSIQSGIAIAHNEADAAFIHFELWASDGTLIGLSNNIMIPPRWHVSMFLNQIPGLPR